MRHARKSGQAVRRSAYLTKHEGRAGSLNVEVVPLDSSQKRSTLVLFEPVPRAAVRKRNRPMRRPKGYPGPSDLSVEAETGRREGADCLRIERDQVSREESQNVTEEALSANEELQSLNDGTGDRQGGAAIGQPGVDHGQRRVAGQKRGAGAGRDFAMSIVRNRRQPLLVLDTDLRIKDGIEPLLPGPFKCRRWKPRAGHLCAVAR